MKMHEKYWLLFRFSDFEDNVKIWQASSFAEIPVTKSQFQQSAIFNLLTYDDPLPKQIDENLYLCFESVQSRLKPFIITLELLRQKQGFSTSEKLSEKTFVLDTKNKVGRVLGLAPRLLWETVAWLSDNTLDPDWKLQEKLTDLDKFRVNIKLSLLFDYHETLNGSIEACGNRLENKAIWNIEKM